MITVLSVIKTYLTKLSYLLLVFAGLGLSFSAQGQTLNEYSRVDSLQVGDTFKYAINLNRSQEYDKIIFPDSTEFGPDFEIHSRKQFKTGAFKDSISYELQFFGTADTSIAKLPVLLIQEEDTSRLYTNPVPVHFKSVLAKDDDSFRPLKPIYEFFTAWWPYIVALIVLIAALYFGYQYYLKRQSKKEETAAPLPTFSPTPFINPIKQFQKTITTLENKNPESKDDFKDFYITLGDAIRVYFETAYNVPAMESTSRELLSMLRTGSIDEDLIANTKAVLQEADMVKFANFMPAKNQAKKALSKAHNFLNRARKVDGPRVEHLRRKYHSKIEKERERFSAAQNVKEVTV